MVVLLILLISGSSKITSLMRLVPFTKVVVGQMVLDVVLWQCAVIAKLDKHASYLMNIILMELKNMDKSKANMIWWTKSTNVVQSHVLLLIQQILKHILMVFITTQQVVLMKIMKLVLSVGVKKMVLNSGALEIHGELTGVRMVSSELWEVLTTSILKVIAIGEYQLILGLNKSSTTQPKKKRMILIMTKLCMNGHNLNTHQQIKMQISFQNQADAEFQNLNLQTVHYIRLKDHGIVYLSISYQRMSIGEIWTAVTICPGLKINTFPDIAALVGLREQQVP